MRSSSLSCSSAASSSARSSAASALPSGDGAASPEGSSCAARSDQALAPAGGAAAIARLVGDDREQPGAKRRAAAEARQRAPGLRQPDLSGVLGIGGVAGDQVCGAEGDLLVVADERGESGGVATTCTLDELVLCRWSAHHSWVLHPEGPGSSRLPPVPG